MTELTTEQAAEAKKAEAAHYRTMLTSYGIEAHHRLGVDKLKQMLQAAEENKFQTDRLKALQAVNPNSDEEIKRQAALDKRKEADRMKTEDEIKSIIAVQMRKGVEIRFNGDDTWTMSFRGRVDSGHMTSSPAALNIVADAVSRGAYKLKMADVDALGTGRPSMSAQ